MKLPNPAKKTWIYPALAFAFPFVGMLILMLVSGYAPFGHYSMLYSDMYHQYYPFFVEFHRTLRSGGSLLYSWSIGMGTDYLALIAYYLASPLNLLSVLVPEGWLLGYFSLLMPVKLGLAGLFFALFLKNIFGKNDLSISLFGSFYALCAWALGYQWNVMWLDTFALLPLVVLGQVRLLRDRKCVLYTLTLFLSIFANYYIGLFTCIFVFLLFFVYEFCRWGGWKKFFSDLLRIACFSALAIGMTAVLELPALAGLQTTQSSVNKFPTGFRLNIAPSNTIYGLLQAMVQVAGNMGGGIEPSFKEGLPNLYCGVGTLVLAFLYLMAKRVRLRDKVCAVALLVFFNLSFIIRQLDYIWHGFHFTNMIPYRFSFLYSFVLLYMAYRAWTLRRQFRLEQVLLAGALTGLVLACSREVQTTAPLSLFNLEWDVPVYIIYNLSFLVIFTGILAWGSLRERIPRDADRQELAELCSRRYWRRQNAGFLTLFFVGVELIATLVAFGLYFPGTNVNGYPKGTNEAASMIRYMHEREKNNLFFRAETTHSQTLNDGALNGYNGISAFTSSANVKTTVFMKALGYGAKNTYNRYCYEEGSPVSNLFLGLKYMIEREGKDKESRFFTDVHHFGKVHLLENNAYLPLGFLAEASLGELELPFEGNFDFQNALFRSATGLAGDVWEFVPAVSIVGTGVDVEESSTTGYCTYSQGEADATMVYSYRVEQDGFLCIYVDFPEKKTFTISVNDIERYTENANLPQMLAVGDVKAGDYVDIRVRCDSGTNRSLDIKACMVNDELFRQGYEILSASTLELTVFEDTFVEGFIACNRDGLLYTSIPQNGNWRVWVDDQPAEIQLVGECMIAVELSQGNHWVTFRYENQAFSLGWKISLLCAAAFAANVWYSRRGNRRRQHPGYHTGKYQK